LSDKQAPEAIKEQEEAKETFLVLKRVLRFYKEGQYNDENVLNFFAGLCGYVPKQEDLTFIPRKPSKEGVTYKGSCPTCGGSLEPRIYEGYSDEDTVEAYCPRCDVFWLDFLPSGMAPERPPQEA